MCHADNPWDCPDTFGKRPFNPSPRQAHLPQWPLKLKLISPVAPFFHKSHLLLSADCAAFSYKDFHQSLLKSKILIIGCPALDGAEFSEKLCKIVQNNDIRSLTIARMDAPCCKNFATMVVDMILKSRKRIPLQVITVFSEGEITD